MVGCFVLSTKEDAMCGEEIRVGLEGLGYRCWREPVSMTLDTILYPNTLENALLGSAVLILLWSQTASHSEWVERLIFFAQQLRKPIVSLLLDGTALPSTLVADAVITVQGSCAASMVPLQAALPAADDPNPVFALAERMAHPYLRERKAAIEQAIALLRPVLPAEALSEEQQEGVLALLDHLAHHDTMDGMRTRARLALEAVTAPVVGMPNPGSAGLRPGDARHVFGVRCKNGHISYFDKRHVCVASFQVPRSLIQRAGKELDQLLLTCDTCGVQVMAKVDCEDYR
jgi:hypothetical protein